MIQISTEESKAIKSLRRLAKSWPQTLQLFAHSGALRVTKGEDNYIADIDGIPNPAETARKEDARRHEKEMKQAEERERLLKKNIASRYNTDVWVSVRDGGVEVERAR